MSKLKNLNDLLLHEIKDLYFVEKTLIKALPKMAKAATNPELKNAFELHLEQTREHLQRLERVFEALGQSPKAVRCPAILGIIEEGEEFLDKGHEARTRDAALIASGQRVEHYEIAAYGCARTYAELLGNQEAVSLLAQTLSEEEQTDQTLSNLAESGINQAALDAAAMNEGEEDESGSSSSRSGSGRSRSGSSGRSSSSRPGSNASSSRSRSGGGSSSRSRSGSSSMAGA